MSFFFTVQDLLRKWICSTPIAPVLSGSAEEPHHLHGQPNSVRVSRSDLQEGLATVRRGRGLRSDDRLQSSPGSAARSTTVSSSNGLVHRIYLCKSLSKKLF